MQLAQLISTPFVFICDPVALPATAAAVRAALDRPDVFHVHVDAVAAFTQRLLFAAILGPGAYDSWDSFLHGLQHLHAQKDASFVITVEHVYRLKECLPDAIVPLARLAELVSPRPSSPARPLTSAQSQLDLTVVFLSQTQWQDIKPPLGASPEPYYIDPKPPSKSGLCDISCCSSHTFTPQPDITKTLSARYPDSYGPSLEQLYAHYITMICEVCFPYTHDIDELAYIAAARWPGFVKPVLSSSSPPSEDTRLRLLRAFTPTITSALESLHPRLMNAADWAAANDPDPNILNQPSQPPDSQQSENGLSSLPRMSKFILVASYIASTNPAKTDVRMFGRGVDEKKRRRRITKVQTKSKQVGNSLISVTQINELY
jgi:origin recognition complex subunit 5